MEIERIHVDKRVVSVLRRSFVKSLVLFIKHFKEVWPFTFQSAFESINAISDGKFFHYTVANMDYFMRIRDGHENPRERHLRILQAPQELAPTTPDADNLMLEHLKALVLASICVVAGFTTMLLSTGALALLSLDFLICLTWLLLIAGCVIGLIIYSRFFAKAVLSTCLTIHHGRSGEMLKKADFEVEVNASLWPFTFYVALVMLASHVGLVLCCVGVVATIPFFPVALFEAAVELTGLSPDDIEKFVPE